MASDTDYYMYHGNISDFYPHTKEVKDYSGSMGYGDYEDYEYDNWELESLNLCEKITFIAVGIIIPFGVLLNLLSLVVISCSKTMSHTRAAAFLCALAMSDSLYLLFSIHSWMLSSQNIDGIKDIYIHDNITVNSDALCKFTQIGVFGSKVASAWITVAIAVDRFVTVRFPLKGLLQTRKWVKIAIISAIFFVSYAISLVYLHVMGAPEGSSECTIIIIKEVFVIINWTLHRLLSVFLPATLLIILTSLTLYTLWRAKTIRRERLGSARASTKNSSRKSKQSTEDRLTLTLIAVCVCFVVLRLPATIAYEIKVKNTYSYTAQKVYNIFDILDYLNYAINFFLYCFCGKLFRKDLVILLCCRMGRVHKYKRSASYASSSRKLSSNIQMTTCSCSTIVDNNRSVPGKGSGVA